MATIVTRQGKGTSLTWAEGDANFTNLNTEKIERNGSIPMTGDLQMGGNQITNLGQPATSTDAVPANLTGGFGFRNRIINGDMRIDQRNNGAAVSANGAYSVDRWMMIFSGGGVLQHQRQAGGPAGFTNYLRVTVTTADASIAAGDNYQTRQIIEGLNISDLALGTASAQSITISFWVRSSIAGTFSGSVIAGGLLYSQAFSFVINSANTWEQKTVTLTPPPAGTWPTDNSAGAYLIFDMGSGSNFRSTAGTWQASNLTGVTGSVQLISTLSATFDITGVQLEAGTVATPFERVDYCRQLAMCMRYGELLDPPFVASGYAASTSVFRCVVPFTVPKRTAGVSLTQLPGTAGNINYFSANSASTAITLGTNGRSSAQIDVTATGTPLTGGAGGVFSLTAGGLFFSAEL